MTFIRGVLSAPCSVSAAVLVLAALLASSPAQAAPATEVQVTTAAFGDIEFDWGRDGVNCPTCNFGAGNSRFNWVDHTNRLWVANIDPASGNFNPSDGHGVLVDSSAANWADFNNGPEWVFSALGSQLVYTRYTPGQTANPTPANTGIGLAQMVNGAWTAGFVANTFGRILPAPTQDVSDPEGRMIFSNETAPGVYWSMVAPNPPPATPMPWSNQNTGAALRWVPGTNKIVFAGIAKPVNGKVYQQVFMYDTVSGVEQQLTFDATTKRVAFMQAAPEFNGDLMLMTIANQTTLNIYVSRKPVNGSGGVVFQLVNQIHGPANMPYMDSPEPFVHNGKTYIALLFSPTPAADANNNTTPAYIGITNIDPSAPFFRMLNDTTQPADLRHDPEYFITQNGPYIYYSRGIPATPSTPSKHEGEYRVDTGLGPPVPTPALQSLRTAASILGGE